MIKQNRYGKITLSTIIIGQLLLLVIMSGIFMFFVDGINSYGPTNLPSGYNSSFIKIQNQLSNFTNLLNRTEVKLAVRSDASFINTISDFLGFFFNAGYQGLQIASESLKLNYLLVTEGADAVTGGTEYGHLLKSVGTLMIIVIILLGIIMTIIFKWET